MSRAIPDPGLFSVNGHTLSSTGGGFYVLHTFEVKTHAIYPDFHERTAEATCLVDHSPRRPPIHTHLARSIRCAHPPTRTGERPPPLGRRLQCGQQPQLGRGSRCRPNCWASQPGRRVVLRLIIRMGRRHGFSVMSGCTSMTSKSKTSGSSGASSRGTTRPSTRCCFVGARARSPPRHPILKQPRVGTLHGICEHARCCARPSCPGGACGAANARGRTRLRRIYHASGW
ncbi:hypothetical protein EDB83DRAFT_1226082 [Lactarius deliciosus]|nr:hypothetical protein EDB83DRAFT_1226082 [Lactarius deliciosus]